MNTRIEHDTMGEIAVPAEHHWGAQTQRSVENFKIGGQRQPKEIITAFAYLKEACAQANRQVGKLTEAQAEAISAAFLGATVLELTGRGGESPWFDFLNQLRREVPVVQKDTYLLSGNMLFSQEDLDADDSEPGQALRDALSKWRKWSYYKLRYKDVTE